VQRVVPPMTCPALSHQEVTGVAWSPDGIRLASGGNDNAVCVWDANRQTEPQIKWRGHQAAVRALAWHPAAPHLLASGGGTADRTIRLWDAQADRCLSCVDTSAQVCSLLWNAETRELVSSHGLPLQLVLWHHPSVPPVPPSLTALPLPPHVPNWD
jgi:WD40 repeat protein